MEKFNISIKQTHRPSILKFEANRFILNHNHYEYANIDEAKNSPLAQQLFYLPFIKTVYISGNFIAIEKYDIVNWEDVQNEVAKQIENYLNSGKTVVAETTVPAQKNAVTVYAESTPNPAVMKFVANKKLVTAPWEFKTIDDAKNAPLATALFHFPFVKEVFFDGNYVSVTKYDVADWNEITIELREFIRDFITEGKEIIAAVKTNEAAASENTATTHEHLDETSKQIITILDEYVKPAVAGDGGNIMFDSYDETEKTVKVILQGACSGCPSSTYTLKNGIETMLKNMLSGKVNEVIAING